LSHTAVPFAFGRIDFHFQRETVLDQNVRLAFGSIRTDFDFKSSLIEQVFRKVIHKVTFGIAFIIGFPGIQHRPDFLANLLNTRWIVPLCPAFFRLVRLIIYPPSAKERSTSSPREVFPFGFLRLHVGHAKIQSTLLPNCLAAAHMRCLAAARWMSSRNRER
jgi:hypothetical protein